MALVERMTPGGLLVQEHSQDARTIEARLKEIDDRLILWPPDTTSPYWQVYSRVSDWQPPIPVAAWMDTHGNPLPLSSGLIDEVNRLRLDAPNKGPSVDDFNAQREQRIQADRETRNQAVMDEHRARLERGQITVGIGTRAKGRHWQRRSLPGRTDQ